MNPVEGGRSVGQLHQPLAGALKLWQGGRELFDDAQAGQRDRLKSYALDSCVLHRDHIDREDSWVGFNLGQDRGIGSRVDLNRLSRPRALEDDVLHLLHVDVRLLKVEDVREHATSSLWRTTSR